MRYAQIDNNVPDSTPDADVSLPQVEQRDVMQPSRKLSDTRGRVETEVNPKLKRSSKRGGKRPQAARKRQEYFPDVTSFTRFNKQWGSPANRSDYSYPLASPNVRGGACGGSHVDDYIRPDEAVLDPDHILNFTPEPVIENFTDMTITEYDKTFANIPTSYNYFLARLRVEERIPAVPAVHFDISPTTLWTFRHWFKLAYPGYKRYIELVKSTHASRKSAFYRSWLDKYEAYLAASNVQAVRGQETTTCDTIIDDSTGQSPSAKSHSTVSPTTVSSSSASQVPAARGCPSMTSNADASVGGGRPSNITVKVDGIDFQSYTSNMVVRHDYEIQDHRVLDDTLRVGDQVWKRMTTWTRGESKVVQWFGRYIVEDVCAAHIFAVRSSEGQRELVHANRLERYRENEPR